jgi:alkanesulfonate monooxygenase SsuD/methylene tetrahydromethanopterin reductase-like flavin-dependent oxidoreductase (luciferase family)
MHVGIATGFANHRSLDDVQFLKEEFDQLLLAEELGFDSIWITEHHFSNYSVSPNPLQYLTWLAGKTKHVRLGTQVLVVPWHDPVRLAEQIAVLDHLSDGRALIGFGRGLARREYEGLRVDQSQARELFDEIVPMVMRALETGFIEGGEIFKQPRREIRPRPLRGLEGRAFCAAGTAASMVSAAKLGLGRLYLGQPMIGRARPFGAQIPGDTGPAAAAVVESAEDAWATSWRENRPNQTPVAPFVSNLVFIDESAERAEALARTYAVATFRAAIENYELTSPHHGTIKGYESYKAMAMSEGDVERAVDGVVAASFFGTPQQVLAKLEAEKRLRDPQGMFPHLFTGGMPHDVAVDCMRLFAATCLDEMKSWKAATSTIDGPLTMAAQ